MLKHFLSFLLFSCDEKEKKRTEISSVESEVSPL